jgi:outer membrane protein OmpA-like peptidoglycan-associated protein
MRTLSLAAATLVAGCAATRPPALRLDRVVLYQSGIGHFERSGRLTGDRLRLVLRPHEVDDVIKTLTVIDRDGEAQQVAAVLPTPAESEGGRVVVEVVLSKPGRNLTVSYAVPTAAWKTTYRVALPDQPGGELLLQAWAMVDNVSEESWDGVRLTLATGAPLSFATDLRTPHFVPRPDASGVLVPSGATGPVTAENAARGDRDGDGVADAADVCPLGAEDVDGFEDGDGCPDPDNDHDRVADADDRCPDEPETYNGLEDIDGCPDRGRVMVTSSQIVIMDRIYFGSGQALPAATAAPVLDAVAAVLRGNPEITAVAVAGHAAAGEADPWGLSARRAAAVRAALLERGVQQTLEIRPFGDTMPLGRDAAHDQRVELEVRDRDGRDGSGGGGGVKAVPRSTQLERSVRARTSTVEVAGATRHELTDRVTVPTGTSTLVSVLSRRVPGEDVFLFRPDPGAPGSELHPLRAARIEVPVGLGLEPGPVAVYAEGAFSGEGLMQRTAGGETTYLPYAVDGGTRVRVVTSGDERPLRLVAIDRGVATVENAIIRRTAYTIEAGARPAARIYLRHVPVPGYQMGDLPPGAERGDDAVLVPVPLVAGRKSTLVVEERQPVERRITILDRDGATIGMYLEGSNLPPAVLAQVKDIAAARAELGKVETELAALRQQLADATARAGDLERSLTAVAKLPGADAERLRKRLIGGLTAASARADEIARALASASARQIEARVRVQTALEGLTLEQAAGAQSAGV